MAEYDDTKITLSDYLDDNTKLLSIGLNPSPASVREGVYFANPRNRFWRALNASKILAEPVRVDASVHNHLADKYQIGFTDVVKRPTPSSGQLSASDFKRDAPLLRAKLEQYEPEWLWFHGKVAFQQFLFYAYHLNGKWQWGWNDIPMLTSKVFISPNPSSANAIFSLYDLVTHYDELATRVNKANFSVSNF